MNAYLLHSSMNILALELRLWVCLGIIYTYTLCMLSCCPHNNLALKLYLRVSLSFIDTSFTIPHNSPFHLSPEDEMQLPERRLALHLYVGQYVRVWGIGSTCNLLTQHWVNLGV